MTNLPKRVLDIWTQFKQVRVGASIDGIEKILEYQRWPIKWTQAYKNLQKLDEYAQANSNIIAWLACTVTAYNIWHIPKFMKWKLQHSGFKKINSTKKRPIITHHVAHGPKRVNVRVLPSSLKEQIVDYYNNSIDEFKRDYSNEISNNAEKILKSVLSYMNTADYSDKLPEFIKFTRYLDKARGQSIVDIVPQYDELFNNSFNKPIVSSSVS
jgi:sulfatase maturation enzyme AslB (radical SAM superfamily)